MQDGVAALTQGRLRAEVSDDAHEAVSQPRDLHTLGKLLHHQQRVYVTVDCVHELRCGQQIQELSRQVLDSMVSTTGRKDMM